MIHHGDCLDVMAAMEPESVDAVVTDPPYGLEFMGKEWDRLGDIGKTSKSAPLPPGQTDPFLRARVAYSGSSNVKCRTCGKWQWDHVGRKCECERPDFPSVKAHQGRLMQTWHQQWAEAAYRVAKPSAYLLAFGGTRTVHRMTVALEDAGWIIRDMLVWAYASGFPKSKASLKPAWEPIVMARKPGPLRMLNIDECRIPAAEGDKADFPAGVVSQTERVFGGGDGRYGDRPRPGDPEPLGRWPANIALTDPIFDGGVEGVVGGGETTSGVGIVGHGSGRPSDPSAYATNGIIASSYGDSGTYSRFFLVPKADRADREPILGAMSGLDVDERELAFDTFNENVGNVVADRRRNSHPTVKPTDLMRHLVRLVTPTGGTVLDPFLGSGTTAIAAELEGFSWIGIEREAEYVAIAEARLNGTQRGLGLPA